jgi:DNA-binding transcriptional LysR family regulator
LRWLPPSTYQMVDQIKTGKLVPILCGCDDWRAPVHLVYARQGLLPLKVRAFIDWMTPRLRKRLQEMQTLAR